MKSVQIAALCGCSLANGVLKKGVTTRQTCVRRHKLGYSVDTHLHKHRWGPSLLPARRFHSRTVGRLRSREKKRELVAVTLFSRRQTEITSHVCFSLSHTLRRSQAAKKKKKAEVFLKKVVGDSGSVWLVLSRIYYIFIIITVISLTTYFSTVPVENFLLQRSNSLRTVRVALRLTVANPEGCCTLYLTWAVYTLH